MATNRLTPSQFRRTLKKAVEDVVKLKSDMSLFLAIQGTAMLKYRIFQSGLDAKGRPIGKYKKSAKGNYYKREAFLKPSAFKPIGRTGKKTKKSMYLKGGYIELRQLNNLPIDSIRLRYTGRLESSITYGLYNGKYAIGITLGSTGGKRSRSKLTTDELADTLEKNLGKQIFEISDSEMDEIYELGTRFLEDRFNKILNSLG